MAGSLCSAAVEDYYTNPYEFGLGRSVRFDHDVHGREALERYAENQRRRKVTLVWSPADVAAIVQSLVADGTQAKFFEFPKGRYGLYQIDDVVQGDRRVGISTDDDYVAHDQRHLSLATFAIDIPDGAEV